MSKAVVCLAENELAARTMLRPAAGQAPPMSDGSVSVILKLRESLRELHRVKENPSISCVLSSFCSPAPVEMGITHIHYMGEQVERALRTEAGGRSFQDFFKHICSQCEELLACAGKVWGDQAIKIAEHLEECVPEGWVLRKEELLSNDAAARMLLDNKEGYSKTGGLAQQAMTYSKLIRKLHKDGFGFLLDASLAKRLRDSALDGIECVCFTYATHFLRIEWTAYATGSERLASACDQMRTKFRSHKVELSA
eukprot:4147646-Karenia_brevis.AAC.1